MRKGTQINNHVYESLERLSDFIRIRNLVGKQIANIVDRPAQLGHVGEYIGSKIFNIELSATAVQKAIDGHFSDGPLEGKSVNIKWYPKRENMLGITPDALPDFYLVFTGPWGQQNHQGERCDLG